jgi:hypothetical protein
LSAEKRIHKYDGINRTYVRIVCDHCGAERWVTISNAKQLETPGHLCVKCRTTMLNKSLSIYGDIPGMIRDRCGSAKIPKKCPICNKERSVRANGSAYCRSCKHTLVMKVGVLDINGKTCPKCLEYKLFDEYYNVSTRKDGKGTYCKSCSLVIQRERGTKRRYAGLNRVEWENILKRFDYKCVACGSKERLEADHVISVKNGGKSIYDNIQPLCMICNRSKGKNNIDYRPNFIRSRQIEGVVNG